VRYDWPGNVRELINTIERALLMSSSSMIHISDLPEAVALSPSGVGDARVKDLLTVNTLPLPEDWLERPLPSVREEVWSNIERAYLEGILRRTRGRVGPAAARAGIHPRSLYNKMQLYGIRKEDFKRTVRKSPPDRTG
jgi:DNA-binding NtrC family response regulator